MNNLHAFSKFADFFLKRKIKLKFFEQIFQEYQCQNVFFHNLCMQAPMALTRPDCTCLHRLVRAFVARLCIDGEKKVFKKCILSVLEREGKTKTYNPEIYIHARNLL